MLRGANHFPDDDNQVQNELITLNSVGRHDFHKTASKDNGRALSSTGLDTSAMH